MFEKKLFFIVLLFIFIFFQHLKCQSSLYPWRWNFIFASDHFDRNLTYLEENVMHKEFLKIFSADFIANMKQVKAGDIVWIPVGFLPIFVEHVFPVISNPFILISSYHDFSPNQLLDEACKILINSEKLIHWFIENYDFQFSCSKLSPIPIGINYHAQLSIDGCGWGMYQTLEAQEKILEDIVKKSCATNQRVKVIYSDWHLNDNLGSGSLQLFKRIGYTRLSLKKQLEDRPFIYFQQNYLPRVEMWERKSKFAFSISPHGNGLDCYRTWEDLILGMIVIVKTSTLDPLYEGLPVVIVQDWSEVTEENLAKWLQQYGDAFTNPSYREKLTSAYWINKIKSKQREWREQNGYLPDGRPLAHQAKDALQAQLAAMRKSVRKSAKRRQG